MQTEFRSGEKNVKKGGSRAAAQPWGAYLHPQVQEVFHHVDLPIRGCGVQRGVALLVLAGDFGSVVYQQRHDVQVTWTNTAAKTSVTFRRQFVNSLCPQRSLRASFTASVFSIQPASWKIVNEHLLGTPSVPAIIVHPTGRRGMAQ